MADRIRTFFDLEGSTGVSAPDYGEQERIARRRMDLAERQNRQQQEQQRYSNTQREQATALARSGVGAQNDLARLRESGINARQTAQLGATSDAARLRRAQSVEDRDLRTEEAKGSETRRNRRADDLRTGNRKYVRKEDTRRRALDLAEQQAKARQDREDFDHEQATKTTDRLKLSSAKGGGAAGGGGGTRRRSSGGGGTPDDPWKGAKNSVWKIGQSTAKAKEARSKQDASDRKNDESRALAKHKAKQALTIKARAMKKQLDKKEISEAQFREFLTEAEHTFQMEHGDKAPESDLEGYPLPFGFSPDEVRDMDQESFDAMPPQMQEQVMAYLQAAAEEEQETGRGSQEVMPGVTVADLEKLPPEKQREVMAFAQFRNQQETAEREQREAAEAARDALLQPEAPPPPEDMTPRVSISLPNVEREQRVRAQRDGSGGDSMMQVNYDRGVQDDRAAASRNAQLRDAAARAENEGAGIPEGMGGGTRSLGDVVGDAYDTVIGGNPVSEALKDTVTGMATPAFEAADRTAARLSEVGSGMAQGVEDLGQAYKGALRAPWDLGKNLAERHGGAYSQAEVDEDRETRNAQIDAKDSMRKGNEEAALRRSVSEAGKVQKANQKKNEAKAKSDAKKNKMRKDYWGKLPAKKEERRKAIEARKAEAAKVRAMSTAKYEAYLKKFHGAKKKRVEEARAGLVEGEKKRKLRDKKAKAKVKGTPPLDTMRKRLKGLTLDRDSRKR